MTREILDKVNRLMSSEQELSDKLDKIQAGVTTALAENAALKDQIAALTAGEPVTQDQLDALNAKADAIEAAFAPAPATT